jgi:transcriptional regulator with XRE-family HTH domain
MGQWWNTMSEQRSVRLATPLPGDAGELERAIGREARALRQGLGMTLQDVTRVTGLSVAMVSKIENAQTSPSLSTLTALSKAFSVPINYFFRHVEEKRDASYVAAGEGVKISRRGLKSGHEYWLLGHSANNRVSFEPYLVKLTKMTEVFPRAQNSGVWFMHMLEGRIEFRYGDNIYALGPGDSLTYDADAPNGVERLVELPVTYLCVHADRRDS